jgi:hypothetical protein
MRQNDPLLLPQGTYPPNRLFQDFVLESVFRIVVIGR